MDVQGSPSSSFSSSFMIFLKTLFTISSQNYIYKGMRFTMNCYKSHQGNFSKDKNQSAIYTSTLEKINNQNEEFLHANL